jgi:hypothetical protein
LEASEPAWTASKGRFLLARFMGRRAAKRPSAGLPVSRVHGVSHRPAGTDRQGERRRDIPDTTRASRIAAPQTQAVSSAPACALNPLQVWAVRFWLDREARVRNHALFDLAIDCKLCAVQILLGPTKSAGTARSPGVDVEGALALAEGTGSRSAGAPLATSASPCETRGWIAPISAYRRAYETSSYCTSTGCCWAFLRTSPHSAHPVDLDRR